MPTKEDNDLLQYLTAEVQQLRDGQKKYVWELKLTPTQFEELESRIKNSINSHQDDHKHLLTETYACHLMVYLAEWFKRKYDGTNEPAVKLSTDERKTLWENIPLNPKIYAYGAIQDSSRKSTRWQESLELLGGFALQVENNRNNNDDFLEKLCRQFNGEEMDEDEVEWEELNGEGRSYAFRQSIKQEHSLYHFIQAILKGRGNNYPFSQEESDANSSAKKFIQKLREANKKALSEKFELSWQFSHSGNRFQRYIEVRLKSERVDGKLKEYVSAAKITEWGLDPNSTERILFSFSYGEIEADFQTPLLVLSPSDSNDNDWILWGDGPVKVEKNVPVDEFEKAILKAKQGNTEVVIMELPWKCYFQVYYQSNIIRWTERKNRQGLTAIIFNDNFHLQDSTPDRIGVFSNNGSCGQKNYNWHIVADKETLLDASNNIVGTFYNCNGYFQILPKIYPQTILYQNGSKVNAYSSPFIGEAPSDDDLLLELLPVVFGLQGLEILKFTDKKRTGAPQKLDSYQYLLEYKVVGSYKPCDEKMPMGVQDLRITIGDIKILYKVFYVPFVPSVKYQEPIWRDPTTEIVCSAITGRTDVEDRYHDDSAMTKGVRIGNNNAYVSLDIYHPWKLREVYQNGDLIERIYNLNEPTLIPQLNCEQFQVRQYDETGAHRYDLKDYKWKSMESFPNASTYFSSALAARSNDSFKVGENLHVYYAHPNMQLQHGLVWDYNNTPTQHDNIQNWNDTGIGFQSTPERHYLYPKINESPFRRPNPTLCTLKYYEQISEWKVYYTMFYPMRQCVQENTVVSDIFIPLAGKRNYQLTDEDVANLHRFGKEFHLDWFSLNWTGLTPEAETCKEDFINRLRKL